MKRNWYIWSISAHDIQIMACKIFFKAEIDSHCTSMSTFLLSLPQALLAVQLYCPVIFLLILGSCQMFSSSITTFQASDQVILGAGSPNPWQKSVTFWPSLTTMLLLMLVTDVGTVEEERQKKIVISAYLLLPILLLLTRKEDFTSPM